MALVSYEDAFARVEARLARTEEVEVAIADSVGLVTTRDLHAVEHVPPFDNTAVDGFAVRSVDVQSVPVQLAVTATVAAGSSPSIELAEATCARIMTGAVIPAGADAVVMVEDSSPVGDSGGGGAGSEAVRIHKAATAGQHIRPAGDDLQAGDTAIEAGTRLAPGHVGLLATLGLTKAPVRRRPRVGVISTGDELVGPGGPLAPGQIRDSNRVMLLALCEQAGVTGIDLGLVADDEQLIERALLAGASDCDAIVTSGGVSMGDYDYVKAVLGRIGDMEWMQVAIKPAKPFAFGTIGATPVFGLPGNPVSSLVSFELFARPGLRVMVGDSKPHRTRLTAVAGSDIRRRSDSKVHFVRVNLSRGAGGLVATPTGSQGSHQLAASAGADGLAVVPDGDGVPVGGALDVIPLG
ncbi:MAG: molybdopterin molybdotransferase MoeA [Actinomycetia bacterium]|nr:molybdopterin molybdotransferase MoeA [Actinomycetes bacterium]